MYKKCFDNLQQQEIDTAIRIRIKTMPDKKLAEFNFKVMQNILICGHYLSKWQDFVNENCEICNTVHDIPHLLFDCDLAQSIWKKVGKALNYEFNKNEIIIIYQSRNMIPINYMITIISYSLWKFWIEYSHEKKKNNLIDLRYHVLRELKYRKCLHHEINQNSAIIPILNKVIDLLMLS